jgi:predicted tellurium resistance membrane protein TerC
MGRPGANFFPKRPPLPILPTPRGGFEFMNMQDLLSGAALASLLTLTLMEIVLGIDNIVFISILTSKLPPEQEKKARNLGLFLALILRLGLLFCIQWIMGLEKTLFVIPLLDAPMSGKTLILLGGGLFLIAKATHEMYHKLEGAHGDHEARGKAASFGFIIAQILALDLVFSLDSVITAVGMAKHIPIMAVAMVLAVIVMLAFAGPVAGFVNRHPSMKILALSFLLLIGVMLTAEAFHKEIPKGYIYSSMAFSLLVELLNMRFRKRQQPIHLHAHLEEAPAKG